MNNPYILKYQYLINKKEVKIALCVIAKQENRYIKEFIKYYKTLGVKKIFLYDNNDINGEIFYNILIDEIKSFFVEILNFRGLDKPQKIAYNHCYETNKNDFDWIAFYDVDEFLYIAKYNNINDFFSLPIFKKCSSVLINWKYYGDNDILYYEPKPVRERFKKPFEFPKKGKIDILLYSAAKTIVKGGLNISWAHFPHFLKNQPICRPNGKIIKNPISTPQFSIAYIKHYTTRSTEEFIDRLLRGTVYSKNTSNIEYMIQRLKIYYFYINKITQKKINLLEKRLKIKLGKYFDNKAIK